MRMGLLKWRKPTALWRGGCAKDAEDRPLPCAQSRSQAIRSKHGRHFNVAERQEVGPENAHKARPDPACSLHLRRPNLQIGDDTKGDRLL